MKGSAARQLADVPCQKLTKSNNKNGITVASSITVNSAVGDHSVAGCDATIPAVIEVQSLVFRMP